METPLNQQPAAATSLNGEANNGLPIIVDDDSDEAFEIFDPSDEDADADLECLGATTTELSSAQLPTGCRYTQTMSINGADLRAGMTIELDRGSFFHIGALYNHDESGEQFATGYTLIRARCIRNYLPKKTNEVVIYARMPDTLRDPALRACQTTIRIPEVIIHRDCVFTNLPFPHQSYRGEPGTQGYSTEYAADHFQITCRRLYMEKYDPRGKKLVELCFLNLSADDCNHLGSQSIISDRELREQYIGQARQAKRLRVYKNIVNAGTGHIDSYADICAGAGGTASGARQAGLKVKMLLDHAHDPVQSLVANFAGAHVDQADIAAFCICQGNGNVPIDVVHHSFPCQAHSSMNRGGKNDQINIDIGYSVGPLLQATNPLIATFEQVLGIGFKRNGENFQDLIHQLTTAGLSVRARTLNLADYGHCQARHRWFIYASCPGQSAPSFPEPTHGPGKRAYTTIADMLARLEGHRIPAHMQACKPANATPYDPRVPMSCTIMGTGALRSSIHFSGQRTWTLAEYAVLQGFDPTHMFHGTKTSIMKQIGNAVPPVAARVLFAQVKDHLRDTDIRYAQEAYYVDLTN